MVVFTLGTNEQPFDRLARAASELRIDEPLVVQHGSSKVPHGPGEWIDFMSFDDLEARMREARVVVSHAGVGSIMLALRCGRRPIVVPRLLSLNEAVDDHQVLLAQRLAARDVVVLVEDTADLADAIRTAHPRTAKADAADGLPGARALASELRAELDRLLLA